MSDKTDKMQIPHKGHQVELAADRYRTELISTLQELDRRRVEAMDFRQQVLRHRTALLVAGGSLVLLAGLAITAGILRARNEQAVMRRERLRGFIRAWEHPKRVATKAPDRPLPAQLARKFVITFGTALAANYAKKTAQTIFAVNHPEAI